MRGIRSEDYAAYDSAAGERVDPVLRWDVQFTGTTDQIEVWPIPASNGMRLQVFGKKVLAPLIEDDDRADLDDQLIVLNAAVTLLARQESKDAALFERMAARRSEEHTSELQSLMRISYAVFCLNKKKEKINQTNDERAP